jgi:glutaredoxin
LVDVAQSETARQYAKKANNNGSSQGRIKDFPQLFVGGEYRGVSLINIFQKKRAIIKTFVHIYLAI